MVKLRGHPDAADYKHVVLGPIFLQCISDRFLDHYETLTKDELGEPEERTEYLVDNIFWVPQEARCPFLQASAKQATIGKLIEEAMTVIEEDNKSLQGYGYKQGAETNEHFGDPEAVHGRMIPGREAFRMRKRPDRKTLPISEYCQEKQP